MMGHNSEEMFEAKIQEFENKEKLKGDNLKLINTGKFRKHREKIQEETYI